MSDKDKTKVKGLTSEQAEKVKEIAQRKRQEMMEELSDELGIDDLDDVAGGWNGSCETTNSNC